MIMNDAIEHACKLNDQGLYLLQMEDVVGAASAFQRALVLVKNALATDEDASHSVGCNAACGMRIPQSLQETSIRLAGLEQYTHESGYYAYSHPLVLPKYQIGQDADAYLILTLAQLLFNLALTKHDLAFKEGGEEGEHSARNHLASAARLYETMLTYLEMALTLMDSPATRTLWMLGWNNKLSVHIELCQFQLAANSCQMLGRFMLFLQALEQDDAGSPASHQGMMIDDDGGGSNHQVAAAAARSRCPCTNLQTVDMDQITLNIVVFKKPISAQAA